MIVIIILIELLFYINFIQSKYSRPILKFFLRLKKINISLDKRLFG